MPKDSARQALPQHLLMSAGAGVHPVIRAAILLNLPNSVSFFSGSCLHLTHLSLIVPQSVKPGDSENPLLHSILMLSSNKGCLKHLSLSFINHKMLLTNSMYKNYIHDYFWNISITKIHLKVHFISLIMSLPSTWIKQFTFELLHSFFYFYNLDNQIWILTRIYV